LHDKADPEHFSDTTDAIAATLVTEEKLRAPFMDINDAEFRRIRSLLAELFDGEMSDRHPPMAKPSTSARPR
jgi:hypothetical protein